MTKKEQSEALFLETVEDFRAAFEGEGWVSRKEIGARFPLDSDGTYGRIKSYLSIPHRRAKDAEGRTQYEWDMAALEAEEA